MTSGYIFGRRKMPGPVEEAEAGEVTSRCYAMMESLRRNMPSEDEGEQPSVYILNEEIADLVKVVGRALGGERIPFGDWLTSKSFCDRAEDGFVNVCHDSEKCMAAQRDIFGACETMMDSPRIIRDIAVQGNNLRSLLLTFGFGQALACAVSDAAACDGVLPPRGQGVCLAMLNGYREATLRTRKRPSVAVGVGVYADVDDMSKGCRDMLMALTRHLLPKTSSTNIFGKYNIELWRLVGAAFAGLRLPSGDAWLASAAFCDRVEEAFLYFCRDGETVSCAAAQRDIFRTCRRMYTSAWAHEHAIAPLDEAPPLAA